MRRLAIVALTSILLTIPPPALAASYTLIAFDVPFPDVTFTAASGINDRGEIVGVYCEGPVGGACRPHGFHYHDARFSTFDAPFAGITATRAFGINNRGQIVGLFFEDGRARAYVATWVNGAPRAK